MNLTTSPTVISLVQIPLPREGTETNVAKDGIVLIAECSNSITPRGDGNHHSQKRTYDECKFKFHYPARGRKLELE